MKKLERIKLKQLSHEMNVLDRTESAKIVGGSYTGSDGNTWFTASEHDSMIAEGTWTGGLVQDLGYVEPDTSIVASDTGFSDSESVLWGSDYCFAGSDSEYSASDTQQLCDSLENAVTDGSAEASDSSYEGWVKDGNGDYHYKLAEFEVVGDADLQAQIEAEERREKWIGLFNAFAKGFNWGIEASSYTVNP